MPGTVPAGGQVRIQGTAFGAAYREGQFEDGGLAGVSVRRAALGLFNACTPVTDESGS